MLLTLLFYTFFIVVIIQLFFYIFLYGKFSFLKKEKTTAKNISISIIIAAKNEADNLRENLPLILNQDYKIFEAILVNDASTDESFTIIESFKAQNKHLKVITINATNSYKGNKKNALSKAIEIASFEYLLFTDADCQPISKNWISEMASHFSDTKSVVLGYGAHKKIRKSFLNKLIRYETVLTAVQYFSYAQFGIPYMGVGRNLAYKKELFVKNNGFENHIHIKSGDDDLLINKIATSENTAICFSDKSSTISNPKTTFKTWFQQKRRHISTASNYKPIHQFLLGLFFISQFLFWLLAIILLLFSFNWLIVIILIGIRLISQYIIIRKSATKLNEKDIVPYIAILDFLLVTTQMVLFINNLISKPKHW